jgi:hypothetical protein
MVIGHAAVLADLAAASQCEPYCNNPCEILNGKHVVECGSCQPPVECRPGMPGFSPSPYEELHLTSAYKKLERKYENESAVLGAIGWEASGHCTIPRVPIGDLLALPLAEQVELLRSHPMVVTGALSAWPTTLKPLLEPLRDHYVFNDRCGEMADHLRRETGRDDGLVSIAAVLDNLRYSTSWMSIALHDHLQDTGAAECALHDAIEESLSGAPPPFHLVTRSRYFSLGGQAKPRFSRHHAAWIGILTGTKAVFVAEGEEEPIDCPTSSHRAAGYAWGSCLSDWCTRRLAGVPIPRFRERLDREGVRGCVLHAGEVIHFPDRLWHVTCNLERDTVAWGGQGWNTNNLTASGVTPPSNIPSEGLVINRKAWNCRDYLRGSRDRPFETFDHVQSEGSDSLKPTRAVNANGHEEL